MNHPIDKHSSEPFDESTSELPPTGQPRPLPPLPCEQLAMDQLASMTAQNVSDALVISPGRGQSAWLIQQRWPAANVACWFVDSHRAAQAELASHAAKTLTNVVCDTDLPDQAIDLAVLPVLKTGEAEFNRDLLQQAHVRLRLGGQLIAAVDAVKDHWLLKQMQDLFEKVHCHQSQDGWVYVGKKKSDLKKQRNFDATIDFRVDDRMMKTYSRPSVFAHRSIDTAARIMIREVTIEKGANVLELGCGNGAVALAAATRSLTGNVYAVDCNTRAVQCVRRAADLGGIGNVTAIVNHDGNLSTDVQPCDLALLNPPYYGDFAIATHFVNTAIRNVCSGGKIWVVTKQADDYHDQEWHGAVFESANVIQGYDLICYRKI